MIMVMFTDDKKEQEKERNDVLVLAVVLSLDCCRLHSSSNGHDAVDASIPQPSISK